MGGQGTKWKYPFILYFSTLREGYLDREVSLQEHDAQDEEHHVHCWSVQCAPVSRSYIHFYCFTSERCWVFTRVIIIIVIIEGNVPSKDRSCRSVRKQLFFNQWEKRFHFLLAYKKRALWPSHYFLILNPTKSDLVIAKLLLSWLSNC